MRIMTGVNNYNAYQMQWYGAGGQANRAAEPAAKGGSDSIGIAATVEISGGSDRQPRFSQQQIGNAVMLYGNRAENKNLEELLDGLDSQSDDSEQTKPATGYLRYTAANALIPKYQTGESAAGSSGAIVDMYV